VETLGLHVNADFAGEEHHFHLIPFKWPWAPGTCGSTPNSFDGEAGLTVHPSKLGDNKVPAFELCSVILNPRNEGLSINTPK
jgi:hypothetical protein